MLIFVILIFIYIFLYLLYVVIPTTKKDKRQARNLALASDRKTLSEESNS